MKRKEQRLLDLLAECLLGKQKETNIDRNGFEEQDDDNPQVDTQPPAYGEKPPLKWNIKEAETLKKSASEEELDTLWAEMDLQLRLGEINSPVNLLVLAERIEDFFVQFQSFKKGSLEFRII